MSLNVHLTPFGSERDRREQRRLGVWGQRIMGGGWGLEQQEETPARVSSVQMADGHERAASEAVT